MYDRACSLLVRSTVKTGVGVGVLITRISRVVSFQTVQRSKMKSGRADPPGGYYVNASNEDSANDEVAEEEVRSDVGNDSDHGGIGNDDHNQAEDDGPVDLAEVMVQPVNQEDEQRRIQREAEDAAQRSNPELLQRLEEARSRLQHFEEIPSVEGALENVSEQESDESCAPAVEVDRMCGDSIRALIFNKKGLALALTVVVVAVVVTAVLLTLGSSDQPTAKASEPPAVSVTPSPTSSPLNNTIVGVVGQDDDLATLRMVIDTADHDGFFSGPGPFTLFSPTNSAFESFDKDLFTRIMSPEWKMHLRELLGFHTANEALLAGDIVDGMTIETITWPAEELLASVNSTGIYFSSGPFTATFKGTFSGSAIVEKDVRAGNGIIQKVDKVFYPTVLTLSLLEAATELHPKFLTYVTMAGLDERMATEVVTLFGAWIHRFDRLFIEHPEYNDPDALHDLLLNHSVPGVWYEERLTDGLKLSTIGGRVLTISKTGGSSPTTSVNGVVLDYTDLLGKNGVIHVIREVILT